MILYPPPDPITAAGVTPGAVGLAVLASATANAAQQATDSETGTDVLAYVAPGADGNVLTASGGAWTSAAPGIGGSVGSADNVLIKSNGTGGATVQASVTTEQDPVVTTFTSASAFTFDTLVADGTYRYLVEYFLVRTGGGSGQRIGTLQGRVVVASGAVTEITGTPVDTGGNGGGATYTPSHTWSNSGLAIQWTIGTAGSTGNLEYVVYRRRIA